MSTGSHTQGLPVSAWMCTCVCAHVFNYGAVKRPDEIHKVTQWCVLHDTVTHWIIMLLKMELNRWRTFHFSFILCPNCFCVYIKVFSFFKRNCGKVDLLASRKKQKKEQERREGRREFRISLWFNYLSQHPPQHTHSHTHSPLLLNVRGENMSSVCVRCMCVRATFHFPVCVWHAQQSAGHGSSAEQGISVIPL